MAKAATTIAPGTSAKSIEQTYIAAHPRAAEVYARAVAAFPSGVTHDTRYLRPFPPVIEAAHGSRKRDLDGIEYIDYVMGHGALLLGHAHPAIVAAVSEQVARGTHLGGNTELEVRWAEAVKQLMPSVERLRFHSSGTEASLMAVRLARAYTGRSKVLRFTDHFHGWHDYAAVNPDAPGGKTVPGIPAAVASTVLVLPPGDADLVERTIDADGDVAAVMLEPTGAGMGRLPIAPQFVRDLRAVTERHGVVLILDEVVTGFRITSGGAQRKIGVRPDLTTMAKILAGGLPGGAVGGRAEIVDQIAFAEPSESGGGGGTGGSAGERVSHPGTFNANPLSAVAGSTGLELEANEPIAERAADNAARLRAGLADALQASGHTGFVYGDASLAMVALGVDGEASPEWLYANHDALRGVRYGAAASRLKLAMLNEGVDSMGGVQYVVSAVHSDQDIDATVAAFARALDKLAADAG